MNRIKKTAPCPGCGTEVYYIKCNDRRTYTVDTEPVWIRQTADSRTETYINIEGKFLFGEQVGDAYDSDLNIMEAFVPHKGHCPKGGRKRRW